MSRKLTIEEMCEIAKTNNGVCLSTVYTGKTQKLKWRCSEGHEWEASANSVKYQNRWCPKCGGSEKSNLEEMIQLAANKSGECLAKEYVNMKTKLQWMCKEGHIWMATGGKVKQGKWCPHCAQKAILTIDDLKEVAIKMGGKLLSNSYVNNQGHLTWQCGKGHIWDTAARGIKRGQWCPTCAGVSKLKIGALQQLAISRGGQLLSTDYAHNKQKLTWQCVIGHEWDASPNAVQRGTWCPICSQGTGEKICRAVFEILFDKKFPNDYPKWLKGKYSRGLELDGYCEELGIAFEHQGTQHYKRVKLFHKTDQDFLDQKIRDDTKRELCKQQGVALIEIPEIPFMTKYNKVVDFIISQLNKAGISAINDDSIDIKEIHAKIFNV